MRALRLSVAAMALLGLIPIAVHAQTSPQTLLDGFVPSLKGVEIDTPTDKAAIVACKVEMVVGPDGKTNIGYALRDGQGKLLRKFIDTNGKRSKRGKEAEATTHLDQWSYYKDGFEVYRDVDLDEDNITNEAHWLNSGGSRIAVVESVPRKGYRVVSWKRISAEEASKVLVQAIISGDLDLLGSVLATPEELAGIGVPKAVVDRFAKAGSSRKDQLIALQKNLKGWDATTTWSRFDGAFPHVMPADPTLNLGQEILEYENPMIWAQPADPQKSSASMAYLQAEDVVKIGETWKFTDLPRAVDPTNPKLDGFEGGLRTMIAGIATGGPGRIDDNPALTAALNALAEYDQKHAPRPDASKQDVAEFNHGRIEKLRNVVAVATKPDDKLIYNKEIVNSILAAYQTGLFPAGPDLLDKLTTKEGAKLASYAAFRRTLAEYAIESEQPGANFFAVQKKLMNNLEKFRADYAKSDEAPEAVLQMAQLGEYNNADEDARKYYTELAQKYSATEPGKRAAGALKRLDLVGKSLDLAGATVDGKPIAASGYKGKTLLVIFWSSSADVFRKELPDLNGIYAKNHAKGLEVLGVNLDEQKESLAAFLKDNPLPWNQIHEPGGMDGKLAVDFGILAQPTMFLVDPSGKVVSAGVKSPAELEKHLEKMSAGGTSLSLGNK
jgi:peroxiredoxin